MAALFGLATKILPMLGGVTPPPPPPPKPKQDLTKNFSTGSIEG